MKTISFCAVSALTLSVATAAQSQNDASSECAAVYVNAVNNYSEEIREETQKSYYFDLMCEKDGTARSFAHDGSVGVPVEGLDLGINGTFDVDEEKLKEFCQLGSERNYYRSSESTFDKLVVVDALSNFNECVRISQKNLIIKHTAESPDQLIVQGVFKTGNLDAIVNGVLFNPDRLECKFSADGVVSDATTGKSYDPKRKDFAFLCTRKPINLDGLTYYPSTSFSISIADQAYTARLYQEYLTGPDLTSEAKRVYDELLVEKNALAAEKASAQAETAELRQRANSSQPTAGLFFMGQGGEFLPIIPDKMDCVLTNPPQTYDQLHQAMRIYAESKCTDGYRLSLFEEKFENTVGWCGYHIMQYVCEPIH